MEENKDNLRTTEEMPAEDTVEVTEEVIEETAETEEVITDSEPEEEKEEPSEETSLTEVPSTEEKPEKKKKKGTAKKIFKGIGIFLFVAFLALSGFVGYKVWDYLQVYVYTTQHTAPTTFESETLSLTIDQIELIDEIIGFEMDENYVYVGVKYTMKNKSDSPIEWKAFPLLSVREYIRDEEDTGYILVENTDQGYEMTGLRNYAIFLELDLRPAKDNLEPGTERTTADIFKIAKTDYEAKEYFLTTDLFNEIVFLPELPEETVTDTVTDEATNTAE